MDGLEAFRKRDKNALISGTPRSGVLRLSNGAVVAWGAGFISIDTHGWKSRLTKVRMNQASKIFSLGFQIHQKDHTWYANFYGALYRFYDGRLLLTRRRRCT